MNINVNIDFSSMNITDLFSMINQAQYELEKKQNQKQTEIAASGGMEEFIKCQHELNGRVRTIIKVRAITGFTLLHTKDIVEHAMKVIPKLETVEQFVRDGNMISAINLYRIEHNCGLKDAKDFVDNMRHELKLCVKEWCAKCKADIQNVHQNWGFERPVRVHYLKNYWMGRNPIPEFSPSNYFVAITMVVTSLGDVFEKLNVGDRSRYRVNRSMSVGDVVEVGDDLWRCEGSGWKDISELPF